MIKDTLSLTNRKFKPVKKDRLFYDQYEYCLSFYLDEVSCLRVLDHEHIDDFIVRRQQWREIAQQRWKTSRQAHGVIMGRRWKEITEKTIDDLHTLADQLLQTTAQFKLVVSVHQGYVYTNDLALIDQLDQLPELAYKSYTQAQIHRPRDTVILKNPTHKFRSYFKCKTLTGLQKQHLEDFLYGQRDLIRVSPALQRWIDQPFVRTQDYFFVDHEAENWVTMLSLVVPGIIRKSMHIIPAK